MMKDVLVLLRHPLRDVAVHLKKEAGGLARVVSNDHTVDRVGGIGGDAHLTKAETAEHAGVRRPVVQTYWMARRGWVKIVAGGVPFLGQVELIIADPTEPLAGGGGLSLRADQSVQVSDG